MPLIDRFGQNAVENGFTPLPVHEFVGALQLFAAPSPVTVTKFTIISNPAWTLTEEPAAGADETQLDEMIVNFGALATLPEQNQYIATIENVLHFYQTGIIFQALAKTWIGLT